MKQTTNFIAVIVSALCSSGAVAAVGDPPTGWSLVSSASTSNIKIYQKSGSDIYAQVVNMSAGARVTLHQSYVQMMQSPYNQNYYKAYKKDLVSDWYANIGKPVSVINGDYFGNVGSYAFLSFPVRANSSLVDSGSDPVNDLQIEFFANYGASIGSFRSSVFTSTQPAAAQGAIGGYSPSKAINPNGLVGRMGMCTLVPASPSSHFLVLYAKKATQATVNNAFTSWKCNSNGRIMMDGSASAQMSFNGTHLQGVDSNGKTGRTVPQVIAIWDK